MSKKNGNDLSLVVKQTQPSCWGMIWAFFVFCGIYTCVTSFLTNLNVEFDSDFTSILALIATAVIVVWGCYRFMHRNTRVYNIHPNQGKTIISTIIFFVLVGALLIIKLPNWINVFKLEYGQIVYVITVTLVTALCEEFLMRGLVFEFFTKIFCNTEYVLIWSSLLSSVIFSLMHFFNLFHQNALITTQQVIYVFATGMVLVCARILSNGLTVPILIHFGLDFSSSMLTRQNSNPMPWSILIIGVSVIVVLTILFIWIYNRRIIMLQSSEKS